MSTAKLSDFLYPKKHPIQVFIEENKEMLDLIYGDDVAFVDKCKECARDGKPIRVEWEKDGLPDFCDPRTYTDYVPVRTTSRNERFKTKYGLKVPLCKWCGYSIGDERYNYCPNCGAKVAD